MNKKNSNKNSTNSLINNSKNDLNDHYSWNAADYAKHSSNQQLWAQELIPKLDLKGNENLLDIGCGDGKITAEIAKKLPYGNVIGIDSSKEMIDLAKKTFPPSIWRNLSFKKMDAQKLTFTNVFDRVFSNAALHWIPDQKAVVEGGAKSLKSNGRLLFQMGGRGNAKDILDILAVMLEEKKWVRFFENFLFPYSFCDVDEYTLLLTAAGLKPKRVVLVPKTMNLNGATGLAGWIRTTWLPYTQRLPDSIQNEFINELADRYVEKNPADPNGTVHLKIVRLEVEAYKPYSLLL